MSDSNTTPDHTPGPWHTCRKGECSCFTVMSDNHPVAVRPGQKRPARAGNAHVERFQREPHHEH